MTPGQEQSELDAAFPSRLEGDGVIDINTGNLWIYDGSTWNNVGDVKGPQGAQGTQGAQGRQGVQGLQGPLSDFQGTQGLKGLQGAQGVQGFSNQGVQGTQGLQGFSGPPGFSEVFVEQSGYTCTNPITTLGNVIIISDDSNAYGTRFVSQTQPSTACAGDLWYVPSAVAGSGPYSDADVDAHLNTSSASADQVLSWNGSDYVWTDNLQNNASAAPVINNVTLSEDVDNSIRFTSKGFTVTIDMLNDTPVSQKSIKGTITANFKVYENSGAITNVTDNGPSAMLTSGQPEAFFIGSSISSQIQCIDCLARGHAVAATTRGAGNGVGWYVLAYEEEDEIIAASQVINYKGYKLSWAPDWSSATGRVTLAEGTTSVNHGNQTSFAESRALPMRIVIENDIVWVESFLDTNNGGLNQVSNSYPLRYHSWFDSTGEPLYTTDSLAPAYSVTSDGTFLYELRYYSTGTDIDWSYKDPTTGQWDRGVGSQTQSFGTGFPVYQGIVYDKPSNRLVVVRDTTCYSYSINTNEIGNNRITLISSVTQFANTTAADLHHMAYMGDDGSYMTTVQPQSETNEGTVTLYRYDSSQGKFIVVGSPQDITGYDDEYYSIGGDRNGTLYASGRPASNSPDINLFQSTNNGATWSLLDSRALTAHQSSPYAGMPSSPTVGWDSQHGIAFGGFEKSASGSDLYTRLFAYKSIFESVVTVPTGTAFINNLQNGELITKVGSEDDVRFIGRVANISSNTFEILSTVQYSIGDEVLNLSNFTQTTADRYIVTNTIGDILGIQQADPGFVEIGPGTTINLDFPAFFTNGLAPDDAIPGSAIFKVEVSAVNNSGSDTYISNNVQPT